MPITAKAFNGRLLVSITRSFCLIEWSSLAPNSLRSRCCSQATPVVFRCAASHRRFDAVLLHIKARARELAVVMLRSNHEYRGAGHQEAAVARGVSEDRGGRVNRVFGFSALVADFDDVALRRLGNRADRGIGHH